MLSQRPDLRLVLMSATLNAQAFARYFGHCPLAEIPGFTHPVQNLFLEDVLHQTGCPGMLCEACKCTETDMPPGGLL